MVEFEIALNGMRIIAMAVEEVVGDKRRKVCDGELRLQTSTLIQISSKEEDTHARRPCRTSDHHSVSSSCCNGSTEERQFTDSEESVGSRTPSRYKLDTRSRKPRTENNAGSGITARPSPVVNHRRKLPLEKLIPPATELEEFFASAEKQLHKRFSAKYNYDIVNDTPLEGRFQWVPPKP